MKKTLSYVLTFTTLSFSSFSFSQELLGGTEVGMTPSEVIRTTSGADLINGGSFLANGATELVRNRNYPLVGEDFTQGFYFLNNKLDQVTLTLKRERGFNDTLLVFESLVQALRAKYGGEINYSIKNVGVINKAEADWFTEAGVNINVSAMAVGGDDAYLNVNYQTRISEDVDRL